MTILSDYQDTLTPENLEDPEYYSRLLVVGTGTLFTGTHHIYPQTVANMARATAELLYVLDIHEISAEARSSARARIGGQNPVLLSLLFRMHQLYTAQVDDPRRLGFQAEKLWVLLVDRAEEITGQPFSVEV